MESVATWFSAAGAGASTAGAGLMASGSSTFSAISTFATLAQGLSQIVGGRQQESLYGAQATQAKLQSRGEAVKYEQQANHIARRALEAQAMARARAAAGGIDPFSGSAQFIQSLSSQDAGEEIGLSQENAQLARLAGDQQAKIYQQAGRTARTRGLLSGFTTIATGLGKVNQVGGPPPKKSGGALKSGGGPNSALNTWGQPIYG